ncbi:MAG: hypothetical protein SEPTF4163_001407 [Sporothrix epigloea]
MNSPELAAKIGVMAKAYEHTEKYASIEPYECMRDKINSFRGLCDNYSIDPHELINAIRVMLTGLALSFYSTELSDRPRPFGQAILEIREHFETYTRGTKYLNEWSDLQFGVYRNRFPDLSVTDAIESFMKHIYNFPKALPTMYETDAMKCEALRRACVDIAELRPIWLDKPIRFL